MLSGDVLEWQEDAAVAESSTLLCDDAGGSGQCCCGTKQITYSRKLPKCVCMHCALRDCSVGRVSRYSKDYSMGGRRYIVDEGDGILIMKTSLT